MGRQRQWISKQINEIMVADNDLEMYSTHNEGNSVIPERFIRTLKNKIYKYMTSVSKNVYIDKSACIINEYKNRHHGTIEMKPNDVKSSNYIDFAVENKDKDLKYEVGNHLRISRYKNIFARGYAANWSVEVFVIKNVKNTVPWTDIIEDLNGEEIVRTFYDRKILG